MSPPRYTLVLGSKAWSSWSFRPWLLMRHLGLPFDEIVIALRTPDTDRDVARYSPSGKVPVLLDRGLTDSAVTIWDSLAITEHIADQHPDVMVWPRAPVARTLARCVSAEMHSSFANLRTNCPMDFNGRHLSPVDAGAIPSDVRRIVRLWTDCRQRCGDGGPFLFGGFSAADAMYAPVVSRILSYDISLSTYGDDGTCAAYMEAITALPAWNEWSGAAAEETGALSR